MMPEKVCQTELLTVFVFEAIILLYERAGRQASALLRKSGEMSSDLDLLRQQGRPRLGVVRSFVHEPAHTFRG